MSIDLRLTGEERSGGEFFRQIEYRTGSSGFARLLPAWKHGVRLPSSVEPWWSPISELYAGIALDELRAIDSNAAQQDTFIKSYLTPTPGTAGLPILKLLLSPGDRISDSDISYLAALSCPPGCFSSVAPLVYDFHFTSNGQKRAHRPVDPDKYLDFVERFLHVAAAGNRDQVLMSLPSNFPHSKVGRLQSAFRDVDAPLLVVDAFGLTVREKYPQVRTMIGFGEKGTYSLREKYGDRYALYAFDTKASSGRGQTVAAQRLVQLDGGYSSFGPLRSNRTMVTLPGKTRPPRVLVPSEIALCRPHIAGVTQDLKMWCAAEGVRYVLGDSTQRARHSLHASVRVAKDMSDWAAAGKLSAQLDKRGMIKDELRAVRRNNGRLLSPTKQTKLF